MTRKNRKKIKTQAPDYPIPQTRKETVEAIAEIGRRQRERDRIQAEMNDRLAEIKQEYEELGAPHAEAISALSKGVHTWCEANKAELTADGKVKYADLATGRVNWRKRPNKVNLKGIEEIIKTLNKLNLKRFVRVKEEIDKEAILKDPEAVQGIKGISVKSGEDFVITPFETKLEEVA